MRRVPAERTYPGEAAERGGVVRDLCAVWFAGRRPSLAKGDQTGDVSSVPRAPATRFTAASTLDEEHVRKANLSNQLRRDAQD
jgi:hypothetical protein